jgi:hypothetical protein
MSGNSNTSLVPGVVREFCVLLLVMLFASMPFYAAQAQEIPTASSTLAHTE